MIDTHCHVQFKAYDKDREEVVKRSLDKGIILNLVGTQKDTSKWGVELAEQYDGVYATIGTHPIHLFPTHVDEEETHFMSREEDFDEAYYTELARSNKVIGVGETGLDAWHIPKDMEKSEVLLKQKKVFLQHLEFALKHDLPLVIHCRDAHDEMIEILKSKISEIEVRTPNSRLRGTIHCFTSHWKHAQEYLNMGFYLGFTGVITFPPKKTDPQTQLDLIEVVDKVPVDKMLVETDAPYLAPQKYRGTRSESFMIEEQIAFIAERKGLPVAEVAKAVTDNAKTLFDRIH